MRLVLGGLLALAAGIAAAEDAGHALYQRGEGATAVLAGGAARMPARALPCANCHGADTLGGREGGVVVPPVGWSHLSAPTPRRPAYDGPALARALAEGLDPAGRPLGAAMPRFEIAPEALAALAPALAAIEAEQQAGIHGAELVLRPPSDAAARAGFEAALARLNDEGGAHGRLLRTARPDEAAALDLSDLSVLADALAVAEARALLSAAAEDGLTALAVAGPPPDQGLQAQAAAAGIALDPSSAAVLVLGGLSDDQAAALQATAIFARRDALGPALVAAAARPGMRLVLTDPFPEAAAWARATGQGRSAALGHAAARMAHEAAVQAGRRCSVTRLAAALAEVAGRDVAVRRRTAPGAASFPQEKSPRR